MNERGVWEDTVLSLILSIRNCWQQSRPVMTSAKYIQHQSCQNFDELWHTCHSCQQCDPRLHSRTRWLDFEVETIRKFWAKIFLNGPFTWPHSLYWTSFQCNRYLETCSKIIVTLMGFEPLKTVVGSNSSFTKNTTAPFFKVMLDRKVCLTALLPNCNLNTSDQELGTLRFCLSSGTNELDYLRTFE